VVTHRTQVSERTGSSKQRVVSRLSDLALRSPCVGRLSLRTNQNSRNWVFIVGQGSGGLSMYFPGYTVMIRLIAFRKCNSSACPYFVAFLLKSFENVSLGAPSLCVHIITGQKIRRLKS